MAQQSNKIIKRRRRADYLKRKKEQAKLGAVLSKPSVKKAAAKEAKVDTEPKPAAKKAPAKKTAKKAAKKAPAKKAAKKTPKESSSEEEE